MYAVNFNDGFIWVSATKKTYPILAEVEHGCYTSADSETGMDILRNDLISYIRNLSDEDITKDVMISWKKYEIQDNDEVIRTKLSDAYYDALDELYAMAYREGYEIYRMTLAEEREVPSDVINQLVGSATSDDNIFGEEYAPKYPAYILEKYQEKETKPFGPYVKTQWGQGSPFNSADPLNRKLGCVTIAVGQFMKYYQKPASYTIGNESYSWDDMPLYTSNATLSTFLYDLREKLNIDDEGSGSIINARNVLNTFNYGCSIKEYNKDKLLSLLKAKNIAILRGVDAKISTGHEWICDGYKTDQYFTEYNLYVLDPLKYPDFHYSNIDSAIPSVGTIDFFHMNWGWEGDHDGWYLYNILTPGKYNLSENKKMLTL